MNSASLATVLLLAQSSTIRTTVPLVVVPTTVTDGRGHYVDGLKAADFQKFSC